VPDLRIQAVRVLVGEPSDEARAALVSMLEDDHPEVVAAACGGIMERPAEEGPKLVDLVCGLRGEAARLAGLRALIRRDEDVGRFLEDRAPRVRRRAVARGRWPQERWPDVLRDPEVRPWALVRLADPALASEAAESRSEAERIAAAGFTDEPRVLAALLGDRSWRVRLAAMLACERVRHRAVIPALIDALEDEEPGRVRARCVRALESLTGASWGTEAARWRRWWKGLKPGFQVPPPRKRKRGGSVATLSFRRIPVESRRLVFVLDASRSMAEPAPHKKGKRRWDLVVGDLGGVLRRLPGDARFNVILFRTGVEAWKPRLVRATKGRVRACETWIGKQSPAGWTNLFDALELALKDDDVDAVYVLTDGVPSRGAETRRKAILDEIAFLNRFRLVQINCVQAGGSKGLGPRWRGFLRELAEAHDGVSVRE